MPRGFIIPTEVYHEYLAANGLAARIQQAIAGLSAGDPVALEAASRDIRTDFSAGHIIRDLSSAIRDAFKATISIDRVPVEVRSSATTEDLPDLPFAGSRTPA